MRLGYDTILSEKAANLSGGQRQRLALARALVRDPEILLLVEATSALDNINERDVMANLESLPLTIVAVAHRLSTLRNAHRVVVMDQGQVIEQGTYEELRARGGAFNALLAAAEGHKLSARRATSVADHGDTTWVGRSSPSARR